MADPALTDPSSPLGWLVGTIVTPVTVLVMLVLGKLTTGRETARLQAENDRLNAELRALQDKFMERTIPALVKTATALEAIAPYLQTETVVRREKP